MASTPASASSPTTRIPADRLAELQTNLILSHSCGLGEPLDPLHRQAGDDPQGDWPRARPQRRAPANSSPGCSPSSKPTLCPSSRARARSGPQETSRRSRNGAARSSRSRRAGRPDVPCERGAQTSRDRAVRARPQGRPGADQRHPGLDRARGRRPVHAERRVRRRARRRRALRRGAQGQGRPFDAGSTRPADSPARSPSRGNCGTCWRAAASRAPTTTAGSCRTPIASAASRR